MKFACFFLVIAISNAVMVPAASARSKPQSVVHKHAKARKAAKHRAAKQD